MTFSPRLLFAIAAIAAVLACVEAPPLLTDLTPAQVDFIARDLVLDLRIQEDQPAPVVRPWRLGDGWERPTPDGVWAVGRSATLEAVIDPEVRSILIECRAFHSLGADQHVDVYVGEEKVGAFDPEIRRLLWYEVSLPVRLSEPPSRVVRFEFAHARSPRDAGIGKDIRQLALFVRRVAFVTDHKDGVGLDRKPDVERTESGWKVYRPGRLLVNLVESDVPLDAIEVGCGASAHDAGTCAVSVVRPADGVAVAEVQGGTEAQFVRFDGDGLSGPLQVVVDVISAPLEVVVRGATMAPRRQRSSRHESRATTGDAQPDFIVLVLDATRADHAGAAYGYPRDTLSRIGRWMRDALVFDRVFAQAPYTSCSVPTMFTGVDFSSHGVIRNNDRLHDDEVTLAESLRSAGYRTIGFTATPNNSRHLGLAQGFDEFTEVWEGVDWLTSINPIYMAGKVVSRIEEGLGDGPFFLMVHLVPPHSPYTPPEEFRVYSDPSYQGPADGSQAYLSSIRGRPEAVSDADLEQLIALYDANLVYADTAADEVLRALSAAGRLEDSVLLVTADHGEAFFEHGHESHNSTVYDEMLQVPFLLRLPGGERPAGLDLGRFASLEDLAPTLLSLAGLPPGPRATGVNLLGGTDREHILLRTADQQKITGFRSGRYKLIADRWGKVGELYDLEVDPGEQENLFIEKLGAVSWLAAEWREALASAPPLLGGAQREVSDAEREMLQQLGYIE